MDTPQEDLLELEAYIEYWWQQKQTTVRFLLGDHYNDAYPMLRSMWVARFWRDKYLALKEKCNGPAMDAILPTAEGQAVDSRPSS